MQRRRARTLAIRLAACVVIGVVATIGVAWRLSTGRTHRVYPDSVLRWKPLLPGWPTAPEPASDWAGVGCWHTDLTRYVSKNDPFTQGIRRAGWPAIALQGSYSFTPEAMNFIEPPKPWRIIRDYPYGPILPGFALDTLFYAAIALTLWSAPPALRRRLRRARGQCQACGYDLKGMPTSTCPECGA
jgi:hypothetical protein